jgi:hypothetical protein
MIREQWGEETFKLIKKDLENRGYVINKVENNDIIAKEKIIDDKEEEDEEEDDESSCLEL